jgi:hypothetical protein
MFHGLYETEGVRRIAELSRQVRTMLNFKTNIIRLRFRSNSNNNQQFRDNKFHETKKEFETLSLRFIKLLNKIKGISNRDLDKEIQILLYQVTTKHDSESLSLLKELKDLSFQLFKKIHYFSELDLYDHPQFLKILIQFAIETCKTCKNMNHTFSEFFAELIENYYNLEKEITSLVMEKRNMKVEKKMKQLSGELIS